MLTLVIETSQTAASAALITPDGIVTRMGEGRVSEELPSLVASLLRDAGAGVDSIAEVVASSGPGSLTGLRIGRAFARGLAAAAGAEYREADLLGALASGFARPGAGAAVFVGAGKCAVLRHGQRTAETIGLGQLTADIGAGEWVMTADLAARVFGSPAPAGVRVISNGAEVVAACL